LNSIQSLNADFYELPDETRIDTSPNSSNQKIISLEKVRLDAFVPSQQTILPMLASERTGIHRIDRKAPLISDTKEQFPDWVTGLEGKTVTCEDVTIKLSTSFPILEGCLSYSLIATCDKWENGKSISSIDTCRASMEHGAKSNQI
jgi:hypothetical protein